MLGCNRIHGSVQVVTRGNVQDGAEKIVKCDPAPELTPAAERTTHAHAKWWQHPDQGASRRGEDDADPEVNHTNPRLARGVGRLLPLHPHISVLRAL